ncbi:unnamed protein product [[Candida] boidinii]|nr:unnamed protein product [[Candida] boidinii]
MCKLRLIQYGLILESASLDTLKVGELDFEAEDDDVSRISSKSEKELREARELFVETSIAKALSENRTTEKGIITATVAEERKTVIHDFYKRILSRPKCENCGMYSPTFRKDGFSKIFENSLNAKQITNNRIKGLGRRDMLKDGVKTDDLTEADLKNDTLPNIRHKQVK